MKPFFRITLHKCIEFWEFVWYDSINGGEKETARHPRNTKKSGEYGTMIVYATRETLQRYKLNTPEEASPEMAPLLQAVKQREAGQRIYEWGCKLFYFDGKKSLQLMHFETRLVIYLVNLKVADLEYVGNAVAGYLMEMYASDREMCRALEAFFASAPVLIFDKLTDRSMITYLNSKLTNWAMDGYRFYNYISGGILHTKQINRDVNEVPTPRMIDGRKAWPTPYESFAEVIKERFGEHQPAQPGRLS